VILRRASALVLSFVLASPAAAQIRPVPAQTGVSPLTGRAAPAPASAFGPALPATLAAPLAGALVFTAPNSAPAATPANAADAAPALAARPPSAAASPKASVSARPISNATAAAPSFAPRDESFARPTALAEAPLAAPVNLDALFDGGGARRPLSAAADGPELAPRSLASAPARPHSRLRRALRAAAVAVPAAALVAAAGALAPQESLSAVHWLGQAAYWLANPFAFLFTIPQIHRMLSRRSADVSPGMIAIGLAATATAALNFAFDGKDLMMHRNLAQLLGFAAMLALQWRYARAPGRTPPSKRRALVETLAVSLAIVGLMFAAGPALMAVVPGIALMGSALVPLQVASGFGFTYLMYVQLTKMRRAQSAGDSSPAMMWAYLGTKTIWIWSLATMVSLATAPAWLVLPAALGFTAVCWLAGDAMLSRLLTAPWSFLPEKMNFMGRSMPRERMIDAAAFVALSALILALSAAGYFAFVGLLGVPAEASSRFAMYLLYMLQSLVASLATLKTLRLQSRLRQKVLEPRP
jgi:hypothetical protein